MKLVISFNLYKSSSSSVWSRPGISVRRERGVSVTLCRGCDSHPLSLDNVVLNWGFAHSSLWAFTTDSAYLCAVGSAMEKNPSPWMACILLRGSDNTLAKENK